MTLGKTSDLPPGYKDVVHVPCVLATCDSSVVASVFVETDKVLLLPGPENREGVVDPFIIGSIPRVLIEPDLVSGLTYNFEINVSEPDNEV